jgi:hypothetical protein
MYSSSEDSVVFLNIPWELTFQRQRQDMCLAKYLPECSNASYAFMLLTCPLQLYTELVKAQPIRAAMSLHHAQLVEAFFAGCGPTANVPLLRAHGLVEAL